MKYLGNQIAGASSPADFELDVVPNLNVDWLYCARFSTPEFTSLCPVTGQPDFATIYVDYIPDLKLVESKAFKLFLYSFRNHGDFHEACAGKIAAKIMESAKPRAVRVAAFFEPRGGIPIDVLIQLGDLTLMRDFGFPLPSNVYRGR